MRSVSNKICKKCQNKHFVFKKFCFSENRVVYDIIIIIMITIIGSTALGGPWSLLEVS
jgi:hypothetical protein